MKRLFFLTAMMLGAITQAHAQESAAPGLGEVLVNTDRSNARYAQQNRPVVGLRRTADSVVMQLSFSSDTRDFETRQREIHAMLAAALDRAPSAGVELVTGTFDLSPVTRANYQSLPLMSAGRVDTSQANVLLKIKLTGSIDTVGKRLANFIKAIPRSGRGTVDQTGSVTLTIINPDQYRDAIVKLVADQAKQYAAVFGPDYAAEVTGIDGHLVWSQVSSTDVFLYVPYRFNIVPSRKLSEK
jgi:hypothetical protein